MKTLNIWEKLIVLFTLITFGCSSNKYINLQDKVTQTELPIPKQYFYYDVVWISDNLIAFAYRPQFAITANTQLSIYNTNTHSMVNVPMPNSSSGCQRNWLPQNIGMRPDGNLVFNTYCSSDIMGGPQLLMEYDVKDGQLKKLFEYYGLEATHFSFMSANEFLQEDAVGHPMSNEIYKISLADGSAVKLLSNFLRAGGPTWSAQNKLIAFWGTEEFPGTKPSGLYTEQDIEKLVKYPWDLYVMDENGNNIRKVFPLVKHAGDLRWSPNSNLLAFHGEIDGDQGIWIVNWKTTKLTQLLDQNVLFDWSPDGKSLVIVETKEDDEKNNNIPTNTYTIDLPTCIFLDNCQK